MKNKILLQKIFYFTVDHNLPRLSALILALLTCRINKINGAKTIFCFGSLASLHDINALVSQSNTNQYMYLPRFNFGYILKKFVDVTLLTERNYHVDKSFIEGKEKAYQYISFMFPVLQKILNFDGVMTSNFGYIEQQEFVRVARNQSVPVIVLYKEGLINPRFIDNLVGSYKTRKGQCDLFLCYNENCKLSLLRHNIEGLDQENIRVTGVPRLDYYMGKTKSTDLNQLTLFSFKAEDKFRWIVDDETKMNQIRNIIEKFHMIAIQYAIENPECKVIIKTKPSKRNILYVEKIVTKYLNSQKIPENLLITDEGDAMEFIAGSCCVLGCNSTVLLEALLAGKKIASCDFNNLFDDSSWNLFEGYEQLVTYISSNNALIELVNSKKKYTENKKQALDSLFNRFIYKADGMSSMRVEENISRLFH